MESLSAHGGSKAAKAEYGRAAMEAVLSGLSGLRGCSEVLVSCQGNNEVAWRLYASLELRERSREHGKVAAVLELAG